MKKRIVRIIILSILILGAGAFWVGNALLDANCCNQDDLDCCCPNFVEFGLVLDGYVCVCFDGRFVAHQCEYTHFFERPDYY